LNRVSYREKICGNFIALPTPFHSDFSLNLPMLRRLVRRLLDAGYRTGNGVLLAGGAGGEFASLRTEERKQVAEAVVSEAAGRIPVIVGAQDTSTMRVLEIARFAESLGADGIQVGPPYYEPATPDDVFTGCGFHTGHFSGAGGDQNRRIALAGRTGSVFPSNGCRTS